MPIVIGDVAGGEAGLSASVVDKPSSISSHLPWDPLLLVYSTYNTTGYYN